MWLIARSPLLGSRRSPVRLLETCGVSSAIIEWLTASSWDAAILH